MPDPKIFISYSWSSEEHQEWVVDLARQLIGVGIDVILDKWDLKAGNDANKFMEGMVTDPTVTKVLLICDKKYVEKSNNRTGGAGTEAQIITPELYAKAAQDKFVAVVRERDEHGKPYLPVFCAGRIYFDLSDDSTYATAFEDLVRWAWDKPADVKPPLGKPPQFVTSSAPPKIATSLQFHRALDAIRNARPTAVPLTKEYFSNLASEMEKFRLPPSGRMDDFDELVVTNIAEFTSFRNEAIDIFVAIANYQSTPEMHEAVHRFFEKLIPLMHPPATVGSYNNCDFDNFKFIIHELFVYACAVCIKHEKYDLAQYLLETNYHFDDPRSNDPIVDYRSLFNTPESLDHRNKRLNLRRASLQADLLKQRSETTGVEFAYLMCADFVMYLRGVGGDYPWYPVTLVFATLNRAKFEMFSRARSEKYFERIESLLGVSNKAELGQKLDLIDEGRRRPSFGGYSSIDPRRLAQFDKLATLP
jgi:hypothetical protein